MGEPFGIREIEQVVLAELRLLLEDLAKPGDGLSVSDRLDAELGLSSSDLVGLVSRLTAILGTDPFARSVAITDVRTVGDLCRIYQAPPEGAGDTTAIDALLARQRQARLRRARRTGQP